MKKIIITGGSSGIGRAIALEMAQDKHQFFLIARNETKLNTVKKEVESLGSVASIGIGDVGNEKDAERLSNEALSLMKKVDVLIANAGVGYFGNLEDASISEFDEQFNTNVRGVFLWLRRILPLMKAQNSGQIIVTSSNLGLRTSARASIYSATKHAVQAMVWSLREELQSELQRSILALLRRHGSMGEM
ncbi:MAG: SDR family oxidoreductase [Candidatus Thorarchaeota archaeon]|nr:SDR family oxidoreductase [Candidatus Thorarchaeota archaeon]